jgi:hypothetical protein
MSTPVAGMTSAELEAVIRNAVRVELNTAGLRIDGLDHQDEARKDFIFLRKIRTAMEGASAKVGGAVLMAMVTGLIWLFWVGATALFGRGN